MSRFEQGHERPDALFGLERPLVVFGDSEELGVLCIAHLPLPEHAPDPHVEDVLSDEAFERPDSLENPLDREVRAFERGVVEADVELVAAHPCRDVVFADCPAKDLRGVDERTIAFRVTRPVVDLLEPFEIDRHDSNALGATAGSTSFLCAVSAVEDAVHLGHQRTTVHEMRELVGVGEIFEPSILADEFADEALGLKERCWEQVSGVEVQGFVLVGHGASKTECELIFRCSDQ